MRLQVVDVGCWRKVNPQHLSVESNRHRRAQSSADETPSRGLRVAVGGGIRCIGRRWNSWTYAANQKTRQRKWCKQLLSLVYQRDLRLESKEDKTIQLVDRLKEDKFMEILEPSQQAIWTSDTPGRYIRKWRIHACNYVLMFSETAQPNVAE